MTLYTGYSKKGLKRQISSRKYWRVFFSDDRNKRKCKTYFTPTKEIIIGSFIHNGYVYTQEVVMAKGQCCNQYYKVSLLALTREV